MAGLAAEIAVRGGVLIVGATRAAVGSRLVNRFQHTAGRKVIRLAGIIIHQCLGNHPRFVFTKGSLNDAVGIRRIVERGLAFHRPARRTGRDYRVLQQRLAVIVRQVAGHGIGNVVTGAAKITVTVKQGLHELMPGFGVVVR
ncbi:MAG: hypothetical protein HKO62_04395, partial [Gammaproteobacteria bacterium]|nr:hypothetical protein [Gammaproteobacteria bacterium]